MPDDAKRYHWNYGLNYMTMLLDSAKRVLFCLRYGIGDVVMETPILGALWHTLQPGGRIKALGARPAIELLEKDPRISRLYSVQDFGLRHWGDRGTKEIKTKIREWLRLQKYDLILDVSHAVAAVKEVIWQQETAILDTNTAVQHEILRNGCGGVAAIKKGICEGWGLRVPETATPRIHLEPSDFVFADRFLKNLDASDSPVLAISPVASSPLKQWPIAHFAEIADRLIEETGLKLLIFCGPQQNAGFALFSAMRRRARVAVIGNIHLSRVAALLARCAVFLCNDTGLMHIAAAVSTPVIALFGPTSASIYLPPAENTIAISGSIDCSYRRVHSFGPPECVIANRCLIGEQSCICSVNVSQVQEAIWALLGCLKKVKRDHGSDRLSPSAMERI
jgi:heptosyltransferase I